LTGGLDRGGVIVTMRGDLMKFSWLKLLPALAVCAPLLSRADMVDGIWAVVADRAITIAQVEDYTKPVEDTLRTQYAGDPDTFQQKYDSALHDSLEQLIERDMILHNYETGGYNKLPDSLADQLVEENIRSRFGDRVTMLKTLQAQGMTLEQYRKELLDRYIESGLRSENVQKTIIISPYKIETYYKTHPDEFKVEDQVKLRMIVLNKTSSDDTNTLELAREIAGKIRAGASFAEMAGVYSQGSQQHQGGDWGWVDRSVLRKELSDVAFSLKPGQISDPVDTSDAVYVMLVEDKSAAHLKPLADVRDDIGKTLLIQEQARLSQEWIDGLRKKTYIRIFDN
jgi:peptidyl-prolyl cis-trans isomerase SurA